MSDLNQSAGLHKREANSVPLSPLAFIERAALTYPGRAAVVHGDLRLDWASVHRRTRALAAGLARLGVGYGEVVSVLSPNTPAMIEAHYGVPGAGAVLNTINFRLDPATVAYILAHAEARVLLVDSAFAGVARAALEMLEHRPYVIEIVDQGQEPAGLGAIDYETFLAQSDPAQPFQWPRDEWDAISLNYTSGTTGKPKGVVYHHRGAYLNALGLDEAEHLARLDRPQADMARAERRHRPTVGPAIAVEQRQRPQKDALRREAEGQRTAERV